MATALCGKVISFEMAVRATITTPPQLCLFIAELAILGKLDKT
jgi:hypothetical protein